MAETTGVETPGAEPEDPPPLEQKDSFADRLVSDLTAEDDAIKFSAIGELTTRVNDSFGADALELAQGLRKYGGIECLTNLLEDPVPDVQQCAMSLLGNLLTDVFEPTAKESLATFIRVGGLSLLVGQLGKEFPHSLYAAACMQNVTALDPEATCESLTSLGAFALLERISMSSISVSVDKVATGAEQAGGDEQLQDSDEQVGRGHSWSPLPPDPTATRKPTRSSPPPIHTPSRPRHSPAPPPALLSSVGCYRS